MKKIILALGISASLFSGIAVAEGAYVGANVGLGNVDLQSSTDFGVNINYGYQFNKNVAIEADYTYFTQQNLWGSAGAAPTAQGNVNYFMGAVKGIIPLSNKFSVYGKAGVGYAYSNQSAVGTGTTAVFANNASSAWTPAALLGGGVEYNLTEKFGVNFEDVTYLDSNSNGLGNANLLAVGLSYKF